MSAPDLRQARAVRSRSLARRVWDQPWGKVGTVLTAIMLLLALFGALLAGVLTGYSPTEGVDQPFTSNGLFGTDGLGRSVASRFMSGGLALLWYSIAATAIGVALGAVLGLLSASGGGVIDWLVMRVNEVISAFPPLLLALLAIVIFGPTSWVVVVVLGLAHAPWTARAVRDVALAVKSQDYMLAARMYGTPYWRTLTRELLPHVSGTIAVETGRRLTYSIGLIASLSFLGLGIQPPTADWGLMINENLYALATQPWGVLLPATAIALLTIGTSLLTRAVAQATVADPMQAAKGAS